RGSDGAVTVMAEQSRDERAHALMQSAARLVPEGRWEQAASALEEAAALHRESGRGYDHARCLQLAASLRRSSGDPEADRKLVEDAAHAAPLDAPLALSIAAEQGETAFAEGRLAESLSAWTDAIDKAAPAGLKPEGRSALLRRRAAILVSLGR